MKQVCRVELKSGSKEELLPDFAPEFPHITSYVELDNYIGQVPWHWHKEVELFYIERGILEYYTPQGKSIFSAGSGGLINSNVLHRTASQGDIADTTQVLHIFDAGLISGAQGSLIEQKYVTPLITASQIEMVGLFPDNPRHAPLLDILRESFELSKEDFYYELHLRSILTEIWCGLLEAAKPLLSVKPSSNRTNEKLKLMMTYIHEHHAEKLTIAQIATAAYVGERECFRVFHDGLHLTPVEYLNSYRLQKACQMLAQTNDSITSISQACGLGSSSYFGKVFREQLRCTPAQYRKKCQDNDTLWQE